jgi:hypothetical protein
VSNTKVYHIELRCPGVDDPKKLEALKESTRVAARNLFGAAMLVMGGENKPAIAAYSEDFITGQEEILRNDDDPTGETVETDEA